MKHIGTTFRTVVLCNKGGQKPNLSPCSHEESDTTSIFHFADVVSSGYSRIMVRTVDMHGRGLQMSLLLLTNHTFSGQA